MSHPRPKKRLVAFDLYGTLLSTSSITAALAERMCGGDGARADALAALWRRYQLEYTWRLNSMGIYRPFDEVTRGALRHAAAEMGLLPREQHAEGDGQAQAGVDAVMRAYDDGGLRAFPEVDGALRSLASAVSASGETGTAEKREMEAYVFSNGTPRMLAASLAASPDLAPYLESLFGGGRVVSVDEARVFKPDRRSYEVLLRRAGWDEKSGGEAWLVSANPFDVVGARAAGMRAAWVDRAGTGWVDALADVVGPVGGLGLGPTVVVSGVDGAVAEIMRRAGR